MAGLPARRRSRPHHPRRSQRRRRPRRRTRRAHPRSRARDPGTTAAVLSHARPHPLPDTSTRHRLWGPRSNAFAWDSYLTGADPADAVPAHRRDLTGLPPAWIAVGDLDLLHDQNVRYHRALTGAGVDSQFTVIPGAFHGFDTVAPGTAITRHLHREALHAIRTAATTPPRR
nr:alpha/beta hydrolase [Nocardia africana]